MSFSVEFNRFVFKHGEEFFPYSYSGDNNVRDWDGSLCPSWSSFSNYFGIKEDLVEEFIQKNKEWADSGDVQQPVFGRSYKYRDPEKYEQAWRKAFKNAEELSDQDAKDLINARNTNDWVKRDKLIKKYMEIQESKKKKMGTPKHSKELAVKSVTKARFWVEGNGVEFNEYNEEMTVSIEISLEWKGVCHDTRYTVQLLPNNEFDITLYGYRKSMKRVLNNRHDEIVQKIMEHEDFEVFKNALISENNKRKNKKNLPVVKDIVEMETIGKNATKFKFTLKGYANVIFTIGGWRQRIDDTLDGDALDYALARDKKGYKGYVGFNEDVLKQIYAHPKVRVRLLTGKINKIGGDQ